MICDKCGQTIKDSFKISLSKNNIQVLLSIYKLIKGKNFVETKELYSLTKKGSSTAELSRLKYLGAIQFYFDLSDYEKRSKRSGKWYLTEKGYKFIMRNGTLPSYVIIKNKEVIEKGSEIYISNQSLKWLNEEQI